MWRISLRDLEWRRRRFLVAVLATAIVFTLTLLMAGVSANLSNEGKRIVAAVGADGWLVSDKASGPFTATVTLPAATIDTVAVVPGVTASAPLLLLRSSVQLPDDDVDDVNVIGHIAGSMGAPAITEGRAVEAPGEVVVDRKLGLDVGDAITLGTVPLTVVGEASGVSYTFGLRTIFALLPDVQNGLLGGAPLVTTVVVQGEPSVVPDGLRMVSGEEVRADLDRPLKRGTNTIAFVSRLLRVVAAGIIGSIVYLTTLERARDFAVLKATGATSRSLLVGLSLQAVVLSLAAAVVAIVLANVLGPTFPLDVELTAGTYIGLVVLAVIVGIVASLVGFRRTANVDPALAFGGA